MKKVRAGRERNANRRAEDGYLASLSRLRPFEACSTRELKVVASTCTPAHKGAGSVLVREGAPVREFLIVASGSALVSWEGLPETVIGPGDWFGDLDLLSTSMSSATVSTLTDVELIVMSRSEFSMLFETVGTFRSRIVKELASSARSFVVARKRYEPLASCLRPTEEVR
jgi:CRP-like cAMP-binding protein